MKTLWKTLLAAGAIALVTQANATPIFTDNFNSENNGAAALNYTGFLHWTVTDGTVDLIGNGNWDYYPGNGLYVDLDGTTMHGGTMTSSAIAVTPGNYELSFMLGGNANGYPDDTVHVSVDIGFAYQTYVLAANNPLTTYTLPFTVNSATSINLFFQNLGGDNVGAILDNVQLNVIPENGLTAMLLGMGMMALGLARFARRIR